MKTREKKLLIHKLKLTLPFLEIFLLPHIPWFIESISREGAASFNNLGGYFTKCLFWRGHQEVTLHRTGLSVHVLQWCWWGEGWRSMEEPGTTCQGISRALTPWNRALWLGPPSAYRLE
jgi:hypothetical protein